MRPMKDAGLREVQQLRKRNRRLWSLGRIQRPDYEYIDKRMDEVEAKIVSMSETDEFGKEVHE